MCYQGVREGMSTNVNDSPIGYNRIAIFDPKNKRIAFLDPVDGGILPMIDIEDSMVNRELFYTATIIAEKLSPTKRKRIYIRAPSDKMEVHISRKSNVVTNKSISINLYKSPTITDSGTPVKTRNSDLNSSKTSTLEIYEDPTVSHSGELFLPVRVENEKNPMSMMILKKKSGYLIEILSKRKNTSIVVSFAWFEADR